MLQCHNVTMSQYYNVTMSQCYNVTILQYYEHWTISFNDRPTCEHLELLLQLKYNGTIDGDWSGRGNHHVKVFSSANNFIKFHAHFHLQVWGGDRWITGWQIPHEDKFYCQCTRLSKYEINLYDKNICIILSTIKIIALCVVRFLSQSSETKVDYTRSDGCIGCRSLKFCWHIQIHKPEEKW